MPANSDEAARLAALYYAMSEEELQRIAADSASLTDAAQLALTAELQKRSLPTPAAPATEGSLESAGIECYLVDENMVRMDWFISNLLGGVKLQVRPEDVQEATAILEMPIPEEIDVEGSGIYQQPHCPNCRSLDVTFEELNKPAAYATAAVGLPMPLHRTAWRCHACGREWEDVGSDVASEP